MLRSMPLCASICSFIIMAAANARHYGVEAYMLPTLAGAGVFTSLLQPLMDTAAFAHLPKKPNLRVSQ
ncbi:hypothetical protein [Cupriavidus sp. a3]